MSTNFYTGYYNKANKYRKEGLKVVSISRTDPKGVELDGKLINLSPDSNTLWQLKNGEIDEEEYTRRYIAHLESIGIRDILLMIHQFGDEVVLCCWESPEKFCHRHLLADYINKNSKLKVYEKVDK